MIKKFPTLLCSWIWLTAKNHPSLYDLDNICLPMTQTDTDPSNSHSLHYKELNFLYLLINVDKMPANFT